jgi:hypothetical protein
VNALRPLVLVWALAACAPVETIESKVSRLKGQPVQGVVQRLGDADSRAPAADGTEWLWTVRVRVPHAPITETTTTYATGFRSTGQTMGYSDVPLPEICTLRVLVDGAGIIAAVEARGSNAACQSVIQKLDGR